ncbi:MAG: ABC transporter permease [Anaerolineales bacterium]|nr:ABC transporter permease [Anaerolineales bacterium]
MDPASGLTMDDAATILNERHEQGRLSGGVDFTIDTFRRFTGAFFDIIVYLLLAMGVLIASVGALGLAGTMSTNVLERTREIGVMRAIGASDGSVLRIVIVEGIFYRPDQLGVWGGPGVPRRAATGKHGRHRVVPVGTAVRVLGKRTDHVVHHCGGTGDGGQFPPGVECVAVDGAGSVGVSVVRHTIMTTAAP